MLDVNNVKIHTIDDFCCGDVIAFMDPEFGQFGVGKLVRVIKRSKGNCCTYIELENSSGKVIIPEYKIRLDRSMYYKNKGNDQK